MTDYPEQLAELIILVANIWVNPMIFDNTPEESCAKFMIFRQMMQGFGMDIVDEEIICPITTSVKFFENNFCCILILLYHTARRYV